MGEISEIASRQRRVLNALTSLTYDPDPLLAWRAVEAMGIAAAALADTAPDRVTAHLRQLHWLLSDESGGVCWYAPQAMAEIVRRKPRLFPDYIPLICSLLVTMEEEDLVNFRPAVLWGIGRLAPVAGDALAGLEPALAACLDHADPQVRGLAVWCFSQSDVSGRLAARTDLAHDEGRVVLYRDGSLENTTVAALVREAVRGKG